MRLTHFFTLLLAAAAGVNAATIDAPKGKTMGLPTAPIVLELYSDFMCPHCKHLHEDILPSIITDFVKTGKAYLIFREFPLDIPQHVYSRPAANYATAAARVGKYQQVSDVLFKTQTQWGVNGKVWETVASALTPEEQKKVQNMTAHNKKKEPFEKGLNENLEKIKKYKLELPTALEKMTDLPRKSFLLDELDKI